MNNKSLKLLYVILMTMAFTTDYGDLRFDYRYQLSIGLVWVCIFGLTYVGRVHHKSNINEKTFKWMIKVFLIPQLLIHLYSILLIVLGVVSAYFFSSNLTIYIPVIIAISSIYLFKSDSLRLTTIALFLSWFISISVAVITKGFVVFPSAIIEAYIDHNANYGGLKRNYLELHDLVLGIGYILSFYLFSQNKITRKSLAISFSMLVIMVLGVKRASILGIIISMIFFTLIKLGSEKTQFKACKYAGWVGFFLCYFIIFLLSSGDLFYLLIDKLHINTLGRNYFYKAIMQYADFSPSFLGVGRNAITKIFAAEFEYMHVTGVHSDIVKMFVENGFIVFGLWLWYKLIYLTKQFKNRFGMRSAIVYFGQTIYTFSLYLSDNTENYFICQMLVIIIPMSFTYKYAISEAMPFMNTNIRRYQNNAKGISNNPSL